ncbi:hypothetical protein [Pedobacter sp. UC225_65]|uniref:hypothetical protein n=1 Tax=Pedobacter sp. UC225_65 TaxID=3350173 RepID=UPI00366F8794
MINIDFGRGSNTVGPPITETNYIYNSGNPEDGQYTIVKTTAGLNPGWHQNIVNHTPNDPNGYFMVVNADYNKGVFYQKSINVCPNTTYEFAAYIINILKNPGSSQISNSLSNTIQPVSTFLPTTSTRAVQMIGSNTERFLPHREM